MKHTAENTFNQFYTPEEAFMHNEDTGEMPKLLDIMEYTHINEKLQSTFKVSLIDGVTTLTVTYGGVTLIIPNVILEMTYSNKTQYSIEPVLREPITLGYEWREDSDWYYMEGNIIPYITLFGSVIAFDNKFIVEEIEPKVYKIQHAIAPDTYLHIIQCNFANLAITYYEQTQF